MLWVRNPQMRIFNEYGPTEATVGCTVSELKVGTEFITIGRPIANTCIYILDEQQKPKAIGEIGELYIAGKGVALGYLHLPEQTQERFIANPFEPGQRMYRSGDRARWLSDGTLHYLGRKDNQVKLRGYRIEPEEIQETLLRSGYVKQAIVTIKYYENDPETAILVVYVVPNSTLDVTALKRLLSEELPMYMVPTVIIPLDKLPLTAHGKPDIDRLLALDDLKITAHAEYVAPRNDMEQRIQSIWQEVLGGTIGVHDDFFAIGGHSIKALQIIARISNTLQVDIGLAAMLAEPTIEGVAKHINGAGKHRAEPIIPLPLQEYYEVSYAQQRLWVLDKVEVNKIVYNMPGAYILKGDFDFDAFKRAIETIFLRHETLRTTFAMVNGQLKQVIHPFDSMLHTVQKAMIESDDYEDLRALADEEANTPFDLAKGPLFRVRILSTKENTNLMLLTMHHIVSDAWSIGVLVNEVTTLYNAFQQGNKNPLPPLLVQYKDFAAWQNRQINELEVQRKYWLRNLQTLPARTELTVDFVRPQVKSLYGKQLACALDSSLSTAIRELAAALRVSEFTVMLSAVYTLLHRLTGQEDIIVGTSVAGRNHVDLEGQIGFFVNMIPLRGQLKKNQTYEKLVQQVRELTINAFDHQQYPFDRLVQDLNLPREANRTPLFDVVVVMQTADMATPDAALNGMEISNLGSSINRCEFDLLINIIPSETQFILSAHYSAELFEEATVQIMLEKLRLIVESVTSQPATLLQDIPLLVEEEKKIMAKEVSLEFNF
jgi:acyl carrier protein